MPILIALAEPIRLADSSITASVGIAVTLFEVLLVGLAPTLLSRRGLGGPDRCVGIAAFAITVGRSRRLIWRFLAAAVVNTLLPVILRRRWCQLACEAWNGRAWAIAGDSLCVAIVHVAGDVGNGDRVMHWLAAFDDHAEDWERGHPSGVRRCGSVQPGNARSWPLPPSFMTRAPVLLSCCW